MTPCRSAPNTIVHRPHPWWRRISLAWRAKRWYGRMVTAWYDRTSKAMRWALTYATDRGIESFREAIAKSGVTFEEYMASVRAIGSQENRWLTHDLAVRIVTGLRFEGGTATSTRAGDHPLPTKMPMPEPGQKAPM